ncbi:MAG: N-acetyl-gamma-glutamyl-phosphate reductase [Nitriliruptorales bacterium]|nr:N-acetyl-gamma-glutamyl-phosphate reductase [Nitriliruptorales bacterium]
MAARVGIVGASGYGGAELARLLELHPGADLAVVAAKTQAGREVSELFPNLGDGVFAATDVEQLADLDLVFLATPHRPAAVLGADLHERGVKVVDLSAAFRLTASDFGAWYGDEHPAATLTPAVYGLTEFTREEVADATLVANPGCYPTAALLALLPLTPLVNPQTIVIDAKSGTSGAGRGVADHLHFSHVHGDLVAYGAPAHRHTGEIEHWLATIGGIAHAPVSFTPHLVPMSRGLLATCYADLQDGVGLDDAHGAFLERYRDEPFVRVLAPGGFPHTKALAGSNGAQIGVSVDERTHRVVATCAIDNLGKGAAGQALQNANLMLGFDETTGLTATGVYP